MSGVRELEHTADIGFEVEAGSLAELFRLAAAGLGRAVGAEPGGEGREERLELRKPDLERLLVAWLRELLQRGMAERTVPEVRTVEVEPPGGGEAGDPGLAARVAWRPWAEGADPVREIKGVTYHGLEVGRTDGGWHATVVLDV